MTKVQKTERQKQKTERQIDKNTKNKFQIVMSWQFRTLAMFFSQVKIKL